MKILVTGAAGFIGSHLTKFLLEQDHYVYILDNFKTGSLTNLTFLEKFPNQSSLICEDIRNQSIFRFLSDKIDAVFHLAALTSVEESNNQPNKYLDVNVYGTQNLIESIYMKSIKLVYISSAAIYGGYNIPIKETFKTNPESFYGISKLATEYLISQYPFKVNPIIIRPFNVYGKNQNLNSNYPAVIPKFIRDINSNKILSIYGDGNQIRDFIYIDDVIKALYLALFNSISKDCFNLGSGSGISILELIQYLEIIMKKNINYNLLPARLNDIKFSVADITKIEKSLNFKIKTPILQGLYNLISNI